MLQNHQILITAFNQKRTIRVYLPHNYNLEERSYPVLYMHDGQNIFKDEDAIGGVSLGLKKYLDETRLDVIVVGIDSNPLEDERINEYCPWVNGEFSKKLLGYVSTLGGRGGEYIDFIVNELKPFIDRNYRTLKYRTSMGGISLGALIATFAACRYPHIFSNIVAISSAYYRNQEEMEKLIINANLSKIEKFYLDCGTKEAGNKQMINKEFLFSNRKIYEILEEKIANTKFLIINDAEHNYKCFKKRIPEVFSFLFSENNHS